MKNLIICVISFLLINKTEAQNNSRAQEFLKKKCKSAYISLLASKPGKQQTSTSPFKEIKVIDYRPDTSRLGIFMDGATQKEILFQSGKEALSVAYTLQQYFNNGFTNEAANTSILIVLKKLWLANKMKDSLDERNLLATKDQSKITLSLEAYILDSAGYIPFAKFDTVFKGDRTILITSTFKLPELFNVYMNKINTIDIARVMKRKTRMTYEEVLAYSNKDYTLPVMTSTSLKKGVYMSFAEFCKNSPSVSSYHIEKDIEGLQSLYLSDEEGKSYFSRMAWGYCDGENIFMMMKGNLFPIIRYHNAYYVLGSKEYLVKKSNAPLFLLFPTGIVYGSAPIKEEVMRKIQLFAMDPSTGEIY